MKQDYIMTAMKAIQAFESLRLVAYRPLPGDKLTIGFGSTVFIKKKITLARAYELLLKDMVRFDKAIDKLVLVTLNDNQRAAILSLLYNVGIRSFKRSKALRYLNAGKIGLFKLEAFDSQRGWVKDAGKIVRGLVNRRAKEEALFETK
ncbi:MAG: lysozyme [Dehalococcoidia bacterium]